MKARCINAGAHRQWEVGKIYEYSAYTGGEVINIHGAMGVSKKNFPMYFEEVKDDEETKNE